MSFFQASSASQPAQDSSPFGNLASSQPAQAGGLFGSLGASRPPQQPFLLSGLGAQGNAQHPPNVFGALGTSKVQSTTTSGGAGDFARSRPQQPQNNPAANQPFGSSVFSSQQPQQQSQNQNGQPQEASSQPPPGSAKTPQPAYFDSLLEKGKKRARAVDGGPAFGELPNLQLRLEDIARRARELGGSPSQENGDPTDGKALDQR